MRLGHYLLGASAGLALATAAGWSAPLACGSALVSAACAPLPDVDQRAWWRTLRQWRAFQHRRITHWWGWPALVAAGAPLAHGALRWLVLCAIAGWVSHLIGDWVFGRRGPASTGWRGPGIPLAPWWAYHGLGLKCGGTLERRAAYPVLLTLITVQVVFVKWGV